MIKIITDDGADLPVKTSEKYNIDILPIAVIQDENEYYIGKNIDRNKMFNSMKEGQVYKTSQVTRLLIFEEFEKYAKENIELLYLPLSGGISGTYENALGAKKDILEKYPEAKISVIDSKSATLGQSCVVLRAAQMVEEGLSLEEIEKEMEEVVNNQVHIFTVGDLDFLYRGGRLSKTSAVIGGLLNIMPVLTIERDKGTIFTEDKVRGKKAFFKKLKDLVNTLSKDGKFNPDQTVVLGPGHWDDMVQEAKEFFVSLGVKEEDIVVEDLGCVIGAHTGPEAITIFFSSDPGKYNKLKF